jgi:transposase
MIAHNFIGCDVAKAALDLYDPSTGKLHRLANRDEAIAGFVAGLEPTRDFVVLEATGHHDRLLRHRLAAAGIGFARLNPVMVRRFAEARGRLAKTDRLDARILSDFGKTLQPAADRPPCPQRERLCALARRRDQLVELRAREWRHLSDTFDPAIRADIEAAVKDLGRRIEAVEAAIQKQINETGGMAERARQVMSAPGVGAITALILLAHMPELGTLSPKQAASLAGLAPINRDSGQRRGKRSIRGGRPRVRRALYMAALGAIKKAPRFRTFYEALAARSGSRKLAIIAVARKLITILNAMIRDNKQYG